MPENGPVASELISLITNRFQVAHMTLENESPMHGLPASAEKHFRLVLVSAEFANMSRIDRHRIVHQAVDALLKSKVHAFSVQAFTPEEWSAKGETTFSSPACSKR